jgi:hypothetical protein
MDTEAGTAEQTNRFLRVIAPQLHEEQAPGLTHQ